VLKQIVSSKYFHQTPNLKLELVSTDLLLSGVILRYKRGQLRLDDLRYSIHRKISSQTSSSFDIRACVRSLDATIFASYIFESHNSAANPILSSPSIFLRHILYMLSSSELDIPR
jgi:hypothetical protein